MKQFRVYIYALSIVTVFILFGGAISYYFSYKNIMQDIAQGQTALINNTITSIEETLDYNIQIANLLAMAPSNIALAQMSAKAQDEPLEQNKEYEISRSLINKFFIQFPTLISVDIKNIQGTSTFHFTNTFHEHDHSMQITKPASGQRIFNSATCTVDNTTITYISALLYQEKTKKIIGMLRMFVNIEKKPLAFSQMKNTDTYIVDSNFTPLFIPPERQQRIAQLKFKEILQYPLGTLVALPSFPDHLVFAQHMPKTDWYIISVTNKNFILNPIHRLNRLILSILSITLLAYFLIVVLAIYYYQRKMRSIIYKTNNQLRIQERRTHLIERQNSLLNVLFEAIPYAIAICTDTKVLYANATCTTFLGIREGRQIKDVFINSVEYDDLIALCASKGIAANVEVTVRDHCKRERQVLLTAKATIFEGCNAFTYWFNDISDLHKTEQVLKEEYALLRNIFDTIPQSIFYKNLQGQYGFCNHAFSRFINMPKAFLLGKTDAELVRHAPNIMHIHHSNEQYVIESDTNLVVEEGILLNSGNTLFLETTKCVSKDANNAPSGIIGILHDITKHKLLEEELIQNRRHAEISNKAKSAFLANMTHEMRTAINGIVGLTYLTLRSKPEQELRNYLLKIEKTSQDVLVLINNILDISSIEAKRFSLEITPFRLQDILRSVMDMIEPLIKRKQLFLNVDIDPQIPSVLVGDSLRFSQILINILGNAAQFTTIGSITLSITMAEETAEHCIIRCSTTDTGIGIPPHKLKEILSVNTITSNRDTRNHAGLGLPLVQGLVQLMQGTLSATSELGQGSTFTFTAHLDKPCITNGTKKLALFEANSGASDPLANPFPLKGLHVLVAEDNEINQLIAKDILEQFGCTVYLASNGIEAISLVGQTPIDVILMDIQMPLIDGLSATITLRQSPQYAHIPIIAMTAHALESDKERSLKAGMQDHITKPIDPMHLLSTLQGVLGNMRNNTVN